LHAALLHDAGEFGLQVRDPIADGAAIVFELGFAFTTHGAFAALARQVGPRAGEPRQRILHARECDLEHGFAGLGAIGKDFEDDFLPIDDGEAGHLFPVALLRGRERLIEHDHVRAVGLGLFAEFLGLAAAEQQRRRGPAEIDELGIGDREAEILDELSQLQKQFGALTIGHVGGLDANEKGAFEFFGSGFFEEVGH